MTSETARLVLTPQEIGPYLLRRDLVRPASIVDSDLQILDTSRRNCNMVVATETGPSYLLKQGPDERTAGTVAHEALVYRALTGLGSSDPLARFLPRCHSFDAETGILVLELLPKAMNLREHAYRHRRCSLKHARHLGKALASLHTCSVERLCAEAEVPLPGRPPWVLSIDRPTFDTFRQASGGEVQLFQVLQQFDTLRHAIDDLRRTWQPVAFIHGDLRWENCVVHARRDADRTDFKLVDWEFADLGEPGWDIGSAFAEYLACWLRSIPITHQAPPAEFLAISAFPLVRVQPAIRALWTTYVEHARLAPAMVERLMRRTVQFCGARLMQTAYENVRGAMDLDAYSVALLQLSQNILERPSEASLHVLGLPASQRAVT